MIVAAPISKQPPVYSQELINYIEEIKPTISITLASNPLALHRINRTSFKKLRVLVERDKFFIMTQLDIVEASDIKLLIEELSTAERMLLTINYLLNKNSPKTSVS